MQEILSSDCVELATDLNELHLHAGDRGRVRSTWHYPNIAYEVEFDIASEHRPLRVLLLQHQVRNCGANAPFVLNFG